MNSNKQQGSVAAFSAARAIYSDRYDNERYLLVQSAARQQLGEASGIYMDAVIDYAISLCMKTITGEIDEDHKLKAEAAIETLLTYEGRTGGDLKYQRMEFTRLFEMSNTSYAKSRIDRLSRGLMSVNRVLSAARGRLGVRMFYTWRIVAESHNLIGALYHEEGFNTSYVKEKLQRVKDAIERLEKVLDVE